jgi:hypothetical protein
VASVWAARHILKQGPEAIAETLYYNNLLVTHNTSEVSLYKGIQLDVYNSVIVSLSSLDSQDQDDNGRKRLCHFMLFLLKCLINRPDDQSDYRQLSRSLNLDAAALQTNRPVLLNGELDLNFLSLLVGRKCEQYLTTRETRVHCGWIEKS